MTSDGIVDMLDRHVFDRGFWWPRCQAGVSTGLWHCTMALSCIAFLAVCLHDLLPRFAQHASVVDGALLFLKLLELRAHHPRQLRLYDFGAVGIEELLGR